MTSGESLLEVRGVLPRLRPQTWRKLLGPSRAPLLAWGGWSAIHSGGALEVIYLLAQRVKLVLTA
jgi:hypothetical protein